MRVRTREMSSATRTERARADAIRRLLPRLAGRRLKDSLRVRPYPTGSGGPIPGRGDARCATLDLPVTVRDRCRTFRDAE
ncbi:hypothetical protein GCM10028777_24280 [Angustibacter speluncae]